MTTKFKKGDVATPAVSVTGTITKGKHYVVTYVGTHYTRTVDDKGMELKLTHARFEYYFDKVEVAINIPKGDEFNKDLAELRIANPICDCGGWSVKHSGHSYWCKTNQKELAYA